MIQLPFKIECVKCKFILYDGPVIKSPYDIIKSFEGRCPKCGRYSRPVGHNFSGNDYIGMMYQSSNYFCGNCRLNFPVLVDELCFKCLDEEAEKV